MGSTATGHVASRAAEPELALMLSDRSINTTAVHAGRERGGPGFRGTGPRLELSSAFTADSVEQLYGVFRGQPGSVYSRIGNPTVHELERALAELEGASGAVAFGSGMAALHAAWLGCNVRRDDAIVVSRDCYGSMLTLLRDVFERLGLRRVEADLCSLETAARVIRDIKPKVVHCEIISNPLLRVADVPALAVLAHEVGAKLVVDATFATPVLFRGLEHGVDVVVHSLTKYLGGHGDSTGGVCLASDAEVLARLRQTVVVAGAVLSPFEAWLVLRGLRTLPLRMRQHCLNANLVARWLVQSEQVERVHFPGLPTHPHHGLASQLFGNNYGGMVAFEFKPDRAGSVRKTVMRFMNALQLVLPATTLGDVYSLALYPAESSHRDLTADELKAVGISPGLVRLSVGIEEANDLIADLAQALAASE